MINSFSEIITDKLITQKYIDAEDKELYVYGFFMCITHLMYLLFVLILGTAFGCIFESLVFYISFQFIRRYAGGYHASTELRCNIMSTLSIAGCIAFIEVADRLDVQFVVLGLAVLSAMCIALLGPLDTDEKTLTESEHRTFRKISLIILSIIFTLSIITFAAKQTVLFTAFSMSLILESFLLALGKIKLSYLKNKKQI